MTQHRPLRVVPSPSDLTAPQWLDAWRVEVWVARHQCQPWLASSAIVDSLTAAATHASQSVSGLVMDGTSPADVFVGRILGQVPIERAGDLDPGWEPHPGEPVAVAVIDDGDRLGLWVEETLARWQARTRLTSPGAAT